MKCSICRSTEAKYGNYCKPCLDLETSEMDPEDLEASEEFYVGLQK